MHDFLIKNVSVVLWIKSWSSESVNENVMMGVPSGTDDELQHFP